MAIYWENSCSFGLRYVSWYKYLIVSLVFSHLGFWSGNLFLIAPFPDLCLLVPYLFGVFLMILKAKHSKVYLCCEDEVSGSGSTRPDTNSAPESTRSCVYLAGSTRSGIV